MSKTAVRTLVLSSTSGRYALDDPVEGADLIGGTPIEIRLGGLTGSLAPSNTAAGCMRWMVRRVAPVAIISSVVQGSCAGCVLV